MIKRFDSERELRFKIRPSEAIRENCEIGDIYTIKQKWFKQTRKPNTPVCRIRKTNKWNSSVSVYEHTTKYYIEDNFAYEFNTIISKEEYEALFKLYNTKETVKYRYNIFPKTLMPLKSKWTIDIYADTEEHVLEIEFDSKEAMNEFVMPKWLEEIIKD